MMGQRQFLAEADRQITDDAARTMEGFQEADSLLRRRQLLQDQDHGYRRTGRFPETARAGKLDEPTPGDIAALRLVARDTGDRKLAAHCRAALRGEVNAWEACVSAADQVRTLSPERVATQRK